MKPPIMCNRRDGKINDDVYIAYQKNYDTGNYIRLWIGAKKFGPVLQWDADGSQKWDGQRERDFLHGAWTTCYSRGDFGRNYACGGHWSSHTITVTQARSQTQRAKINLLACNANFFPAPSGIRPDIIAECITPRDGWTIWFDAASEALAARLSLLEIQAAPLPTAAKKLLKSENLDAVREVLTAWKI